jgi:flagellar hook-associated protein 3 FlgL
VQVDSAIPGSDHSLLTDTPPSPPSFPGVPAGLRVFHPGQSIQLSTQPGDTSPTPFNLGSNITITGDPGDPTLLPDPRPAVQPAQTPDVFTIAPSSSQSVFKSLANLIKTLESSATLLPADTAKYSNEIGFALNNLDKANDNILRVRAMIGSRMAELESLDSVNQDLTLQYQQTLSNLQDLDYAKTISDMTRKQTDLEAAQKSFMQTSQLSLFNYL